MKLTSVTILAVCLLCVSADFSNAQNPFGSPPGNANAGNANQGGNPFGGGGQPAAQGAGQGGNPFGGAAGAPAGGAGGGQGGPALGKPAPKRSKAGRPETDEIVLAIRNSNPTTPVELLRAIDSMRKLNRPGYAQEYLKKLIAANLDDAALIDLHEKFGTGYFKELSTDEKLKPENEQLYKNVLGAAVTNARDLSRIDAVVQQLNSSNRSQQLSALADLKRVGVRAVPRMILVLADGARAKEHRNVRLALVSMGSLAIEPLVGALQSDDSKLVVQVMHVLARLQASRSVMYMLNPMFNSKDELLKHMAKDSVRRMVGKLPEREHAEVFLTRQVKKFMDNQSPVAPIDDRIARLWHWDEKQRTVKSVDYDVRGAAKLTASQVAEELLAFDPENKEYRRLYLMATLAARKTLNGMEPQIASFEPEIQEMRTEFQVSEVEATLSAAIRQKQIEAAMGAAEALGHLGTPKLVESEDGRLRALTEATRHPDANVRFAAVEAILALDPPKGYPGSSGVIESLSKVIRDIGESRVVIGHPVSSRLNVLNGEVSALGLATEAARTGKGVFVAASKKADVEIILLSEDLAAPRTIEVYQSLRATPATASTLIAILSSPENLLKNEEIYREDPLTLVTVEPYGERSMSGLIRKLRKLPTRGAVSPATRVARSQRALMWAGRLAENPKKYSFYNLQRLEGSAIHALQAPTTAATAAKFLGLLGTTKAQQALVDYASRHDLPLDLRKAAADGFRTAVKRHRVLLTREKIQEQYDRYNDTAALDKATQQLMGTVLDSIELPTKEKNAKDP